MSKSFWVKIGVAFISFLVLMLTVSTSITATTTHDLIVDGSTYQSYKESGSAIHWNTPDVNPTSASFPERQQIWIGNSGSEHLPCEGGVHWISTENVLTVSHGLETPDTTTTTSTNVPTTTIEQTTTTTITETTTTVPGTNTTVPSSTTTTPEQTTTIPVPTTTVSASTTTEPVSTTIADTTTTAVVVETTISKKLPETGLDSTGKSLLLGMMFVCVGILLWHMATRK
jgi:hypothetical protein